MDTLQNVTFQNETVTLDGNHFRDCTFHHCTLEYSGGPVILERTHLCGCHYIFFGEAKMTLRLLQEVGLMPFNMSDWAQLSELVH